jgi:trehalose 6-phosphate phosphatase
MRAARRKLPPAPEAGWAYFFDVDGTLSELVDTPAAARVAPALRARLDRLLELSGGAVAIVSGRTIMELDGMLDEWRGAVAGQHGAERRRAGACVVRLHLATEQMERLRDRLRIALGPKKGLFVEDKGASLAIHYRLAPSLASFVHRTVREVMTEMSSGVEMQAGKRVVEVIATGQHKGRAVLDFLADSPFAGRRPCFVGDDESDELAFAEVNRRGGVTVKVGPGPSQAQWRLSGVREVADWLAELQ